MSTRAVTLAAFALLIATFCLDMLTPQSLVIAIVFDVPIVLAALTQSRRLTTCLIIAAIAADFAAAVIDAARDGYQWDPIGVGDRLLSVLSIVLVGYLSTAVQQRAERVGRLAAQEARALGEAALAASAERIRASLSPDVVSRAVVRESTRLLEAKRTYWYPVIDPGEVLVSRDGAQEVAVLDEPSSPEIASLIEHVVNERMVRSVLSTDLVARLALERLSARSAVAIPLIDRDNAFGVLVATFDGHVNGEATLQTARDFSVIAVNALAQAKLFAQLAQRNEALTDRQDVIRDLVYALSHDLRTPLTALSMTMRQAADGAYGDLPPQYAAVLRDSLVSIGDLARLAETLLLVARFESGERRVDCEHVDLGRITRQIASELGAMAESSGVALAVEINDGTSVRGSRSDLRRAVANLVANALQHTPSGGAVRLTAKHAGDRVEIVVSDDGYGVDESVHANLFQRFSPGTRVGGGSGLGLYIVRRIAEESGGTVSYAPGTPRGSVFTLSLPRLFA